MKNMFQVSISAIADSIWFNTKANETIGIVIIQDRVTGESKACSLKL